MAQLEISTLAIELEKGVLYGDIDAVRKVIFKSSSNINRVATCTPRLPFKAVHNNYSLVLQELVLHGWNVNQTDDQGRTLLHEAVMHSSRDCLKVLLKQPNLNLDIQDNQSCSPLSLAINRGMLDVVTLLLQHDCDITLVDGVGNTPLHEAAEGGHVEICRSLILNGCKVDKLNACNETPLHLAAIEGYDEVVLLLIQNGATVNVSEGLSSTPLHYACMCGHVKVASILVTAGADIDRLDADKNTPMMLALQNDHLDVVKYLIVDRKANTNILNAIQQTPLHCAAKNNRPDIIEILLESGVDPMQQEFSGKTALSTAASSGFLAVVSLLAKDKNCIDVPDVMNMTPLHWAITGNHIECVKELLKNGADPNTITSGQGNSSLMMAIEFGHEVIAQCLIEAGCDISVTNNQGRSAIYEASQSGSLVVLLVLLKWGADINTRSSNGDTPLIIASRCGHTNIVSTLLDLKCNSRISNDNHINALHEAALWGHDLIADLLIKEHLEVDLTELDGDTPLLLASSKGHTKVVQSLLEHGADVRHHNDMGRSALCEAADRGHVDIVKMLIDHGSNLNQADIEGDPSLILAVSKGHHIVVAVLLKAEADMYILNKCGRNALHEACCLPNGPVLSLEFLLNAGMEPDIDDSMGNPPIVLATFCGRRSFVYALLKANCDVNKPGRSVGKHVKAIQIAITKEAFRIAEMLYLCGADMNAVNVWMESPNEAPVYLIPVRDPDMKSWLEMVTSNAAPLKILCRYAIRRQLGLRPDDKIRTLPIPQQMIQYLMLADLEELAVSDQQWALPPSGGSTSGSQTMSPNSSLHLPLYRYSDTDSGSIPSI